MSMRIIDEKAAKRTFPVAIVVSRFNETITVKLLEGALARLKERDFPDSDVLVAWVPGAVEIPVTLQRLAQSGRYDALIALGAVVRGETTHYDYVCEQVSDGCLKVALENDLPVIFGVLTTENEEQALARCGGAHGHKGKDAVDAAVETVAVLRELD